MQRDLNHYLKRKQRWRRFIVILIITMLAAATAVFMRECNQKLDEPYNKDYIPLDNRTQPTRDLS